MASIPKRISAAVTHICQAFRNDGQDLDPKRLSVRCGDLAYRTLVLQAEDGEVCISHDPEEAKSGVTLYGLPVVIDPELMQNKIWVCIDGNLKTEIPLLGTVS